MFIGLALSATPAAPQDTGLALPQPSVLPGVSGSDHEGGQLSADAGDAWSLGGAPANVAARSYRLLLGGETAVPPQAAPTVALPAGSGGAAYAMQLRVEVAEAPGLWSSWVTIAGGTVAALPRLSAATAQAAGSDGCTGSVHTDTGTGTLWWAVTTEAMPPADLRAHPSAQSRPVAAAGVQAVAAGGLAAATTYHIHYLQTDGAGRDSAPLSSAAFTTGAAATVPGAFGAEDWSIADAGTGGDAVLTVTALPSDGGAALTGIEYRIDGGAWAPLGATAAGSYLLTDRFADGVPATVSLRAVNTAGPATSYSSKTVTTTGPGLSFAPGQDAGLFGWWDADDAATLTGAPAVAQWADRSGQGAALVQGNAALRPATGTRSLNGRNVLDFPGTASLGATGFALPASGDFALHMVATIDAVTDQFQSLVSMDAAADDWQLDAGVNGAFAGRLNTFGIGSGLTLSGGPFSGPALVSLMFDRAGGTFEVFVDGVSRGAGAYTRAVATPQLLRLMSNRASDRLLDGAVAEVCITSSLGNRAGYTAYLQEKWLTAAAPSGSIAVTSATWTPGGNGSGPSLAIEGSETGTMPGYTLLAATHPTGTTLAKAEIEAGTGAAADAFGITAATLAGLDATGIPLGTSLADGRLSLFVRDAAGAESDVFTIDGVTVDATPATLSAPTAGATGQTTATWGATSNEGGGTVFAGLRPAGAAALTAAQLVAGSGGAGVAWGSDASMTANAANGGVFTGLAAGTSYAADIVAVDGWGNVSTVISSASFSTAAAPSGPDLALLGVRVSSFVSADPVTDLFDLSALSTGTRLLIGVGMEIEPTGVSVNGNPAAFVTGTAQSGSRKSALYQYVLQAGDIGPSVPIVTTRGTAVNYHGIAVCATGGTIASHDAESHFDAAAATYTLTSTTPSANRIVGFFFGQESGMYPGRLVAPQGFALLGEATDGGVARAGAVLSATGFDPGAGITVQGSVGTERFGGVMVVIE
jgi:hypothetical protein